jgi:hypothetical protein
MYFISEFRYKVVRDEVKPALNLDSLLCAFVRQLTKATKSLVMSVRPSVCLTERMNQGTSSTDFREIQYLGFVLKFIGTFRVCFKSDKKTCTSQEDIHTFTIFHRLWSL